MVKNKDNPLVGGQAVIEGVMMRGNGKIATAVRTPNGGIITKIQDFTPFTEKHRIFNIFLIRGFINLVEMMVVGIKTLSFSAEVALDDGSKSKSNKINGIELFFTFIFAMGTSVLLFVVLPAGAFILLKNKVSNILLLNLLEGLIRISIFFIFLGSTMFSHDMRRIFQYHGAEHKTVHTHENGIELNYTNIKKHPKEHSRCGTSFIMVVFIISIFIFSLLGRTTFLYRIIAKILLMPIISGISYEIMKFLSKHDKNILIKIFTLPGIITQKITTREPDDKQIEVAMTALKGVVF